MRSGCYTNTGWVVRVTTSGVEVQTGVMQNDGTWNAHELERFDSDGKGLGEGTYECGAWELDGISFEGRTSLLKRTWAYWRQKLDQAKKGRS